MSFFKIEYQVDSRGVRRYPACVGGVVWNHCAYHPTDRWMIGQTDAAFTPDGQQAVPIGDVDAAALLAQLSQLVAAQASAAGPRPTPFNVDEPAKDAIAAPKAKRPAARRGAASGTSTDLPDDK